MKQREPAGAQLIGRRLDRIRVLDLEFDARLRHRPVGGYTYITRAQGTPLFRGEPPALTKNPDGSDTVVLTNKGKGHQHQRNWLALIRDLTAGHGPCVASNSPRSRIRHVRVRADSVTIRGTARDLGCKRGIKWVEVALARRVRGHRCRFADRSGNFGRRVACSHRHFVRARGTGSWSLRFVMDPPDGPYEAWARAVTRSGDRESLAGRNGRAFVVR